MKQSHIGQDLDADQFGREEPYAQEDNYHHQQAYQPYALEYGSEPQPIESKESEWQG